MQGNLKLTVIILIGVLLASNAWWAYRLFDASVTATYRNVELDDYREALTQALAILPVAADLRSNPADVLEAARKSGQSDTAFEKEGYIWIGKLGLKFSTNGRLVEAIPSWSPF